MFEFLHKHKAIFGIFFFVILIGFILSLIGTQGYTGADQSFNFASQDLAKVEGIKITQREVMSAYQEQLNQAEEYLRQQIAQNPQAAQNQEFFRQMMLSQVNPESALEGLINEKFRLKTTEALGLEVPDQSVQRFIVSYPAFQKDGKFDPILYKNLISGHPVLAAQGKNSPAAFEQDIRHSINAQTLGKVFTEHLSIKSALQKKQDQLTKTQYTFETLEISPSKVKIEGVSDAEVKSFTDNKDNEKKIEAYYNTNLKNYESPEQLKAAHILIPEDKGGEKKANEILSEIESKKISFEDAAKKYSTDGSASQGGDLGFFGRGAMVPEFETAAFALKKDGDMTTKAVKSQFGWHLIKRLQYNAATKKDLSSVKAEIAKKILEEEKRKSLVESLSQEWEKTDPNEATLKKHSLSWQKQSPWTPENDMLPGVGSLNDSDLGAVLKLNSQNKKLGKRIPKGDAWVFVRLLERKESPANESTLTDSSAGQEAFYTFLSSRKKRLEKDGKIVKYTSRLQKLNIQAPQSR